MKRIPTTLLVVLFLGYATVFVRACSAAGLRLRPVFDPLSHVRVSVEQLIVARHYAKALPLAARSARELPETSRKSFQVGHDFPWAERLSGRGSGMGGLSAPAWCASGCVSGVAGSVPTCR